MERQLDRELYPEYKYTGTQGGSQRAAQREHYQAGKDDNGSDSAEAWNQKITQDDPEYWGLAGVLTDEEAEIALKMGVRKPKTLAEMVKLTGLPEKVLETKLQKMSVKGILEYNWENPRHEKQYLSSHVCAGVSGIF